MRAYTKRKNDIGKRFAIVIGVAAAGVMALGAQSAAAAPDVVKYDTKLSGHRERGRLYHGAVESEFQKCMEGRRVVLFKKRRGADRKLGTDRSEFDPDAGWGRWELTLPRGADVDYGKVRREVGDGFVCRADRDGDVEIAA
jgi:hypothetical protein